MKKNITGKYMLRALRSAKAKRRYTKHSRHLKCDAGDAR